LPVNAQKKILEGSLSSVQYLQSKRYIQNFYKKEIINKSGYITHLTFYPDTDPFINYCNGIINQATIYVGETTQTSYNGSDWISIDMQTPVYSGKIFFNCDSVEIKLDKPFFYSGTNNLCFSFLFENITGNVSLRGSVSTGYIIYSSNFDNSDVVKDPPVPSNAANQTINLGVTFNSVCPDYFWVFPQSLSFSHSSLSKDSINIFTNGSLNYSISYVPTWLNRENSTNSVGESFSTNTANESYSNIKQDSIIVRYGLNNERIVIKTIQNAIPLIEELKNYNIYDTIRVLKSFDYDNDYYYEFLCMLTRDNSYLILKREGSGYKTIKIGTNNYGGDLGNVIIDDINHDNNPDIIILEGGGPFIGRVVIFYNKLTYFESPAITIDPLSTDLKLIDIDNDGDKDIMLSGIITNYFNDPFVGEARVRFYENSNNSFILRDDVKLTDAIGKNSPYDFDNDGDVDILMSGSDINGNTNTYLLINNGNWLFTERQINIKGYCTGETISGDINSDGLADAATIGALCFLQNGEVFIYNQSADFLFTKQDYQLAKYPKGEIKLGDFTSDGKLDLLAATYDEWRTNSTSDIYINSQTAFSTGNFGLIKLNYNVNLVLTDISNDNNLDFILSGVHNLKNTAIFYHNNSPINNNIPSPPDSIWASTSLDNVTLNWSDGSDNETPVSGLTYNFRIGTTRNGNEIVSSNSHNSGKRKIFEFGNAYQNNSCQIKNLSPGKYYWSVQSIDNSFTGSEFAQVDSFIIHNVFELQATNLQDITYGNSKWADLDNDSDPDLILMGGTNIYVDPKTLTSIYYNNNGVFLHNASDTITGMFNTNPGLKVADIDNDNLVDIILCGSRGWSGTCITKVFRNTGSGFAGLPFEVNSDNGTTVDVGDFNNDGLTDIVISNAKTFIYFNKGNGQFERSTFELQGYPNAGVKVVDIDNDQDYDLILIGDSYYQSRIYVNDGGNFSGLFNFPFFTSGSIGLIDFNNDNYFDFIVHGNSTINGSYGNVTALFKNSNGRSFSSVDHHIRGVSFSDIEIADYNNDGWSDLVISGNSSNRITRLYENLSGNEFIEKDFAFQATSFGSLSFADVFKDGTLDLLVTGGDGIGFIKLYRNFGDWKNDPPDPPTSPVAKHDGSTLRLSWNRASDKQSGTNGLTYNLRIGTTPGGGEIISPLSDPVSGFRKIPEPGNVQMNTGWHLENLPRGNYYWSVQAIDQSFAGGAWSPEQTFKISLVTASFSADTACLGSSTQFIDKSFTSGISINSWKWDFGDGNSSAIQNPVHTFANPGTHLVKLVVSSPESSDTIINPVTVLPKPSASFLADPVCHGSKSIFQNNSLINNTTISSWSWTFGDGQSYQQKDPPDHYYAQPGNFNVKLKIVADNGCSDSITKVTVVGEYPIVILSANGPLEFCSGNNVKLSVPKKDQYSYQWELNEIPVTDSVNSKFTAVFSGKYSVKVNNTVANCMSNSPKVDVKVSEKPATPMVTYNGTISGLCPDTNNVDLKIDQYSTTYLYQWRRNGIPIDNAVGIGLTGIFKTGSYSVTASYGGCSVESNSIEISYLDAYPKPLVYVKGPVVWYMASSNDSAANYQWYLNNEMITGADKNIYVANQNMGTYKVAIGNEEGCITMSDEITIPVSKGEMTDFKIPQEYLISEKTDPFENLRIYPNPTPGLFTVEMDNPIFGELSIDILTQAGARVLNIRFEKTTSHFLTHIDLSGQPRGMYLVNLMLQEYFATRKLIVE
jgi:PKD repeat protein